MVKSVYKDVKHQTVPQFVRNIKESEGVDMGKNKKVKCDTCGKDVRSNNLKRYNKTHKDIYLLTSKEEIRVELERRHENAVQRELKRQQIEAITQEGNYSLPHEIVQTATSWYTVDIEERLLKK